MSLVTRCASCGTAFRVQPAQLSARAGQVRCGKCGEVFDGIAGLLEEGTELLRLEPSPQLGLFDPGRRSAQRGDDDAPTDEAPVPEFLLKPEPSPRSRLLWGSLTLLAVALLVVQGAYRYRTELSAVAPAARPALAWGCQLLHCEIPLPRRPELMSIDSSDLQADAKSDAVIVLNAVLRNKAPFAQQLPTLELTLTDERDRPVLRKVLFPRDYLDPARQGALRQGLAAGSEMSLRVNFDAGRLRATGYRLYLFFPQ